MQLKLQNTSPQLQFHETSVEDPNIDKRCKSCKIFSQDINTYQHIARGSCHNPKQNINQSWVGQQLNQIKKASAFRTTITTETTKKRKTATTTKQPKKNGM